MNKIAIACVALVAGAGAAVAYHQVSVKGPVMVRYCEAVIRSVMKSPASYRRHDVRRTNDSIFIEFDGANGYGVLLRQRAECQFAIPANQKPGFWDMPEMYRATLDGREVQNLSMFAVGARAEAKRFW